MLADIPVGEILQLARGHDAGRVLQAAAPGITDIIIEAAGQAPEEPTHKPHRVSVLTIRITQTRIVAQVSVPLPDGTELWT